MKILDEDLQKLAQTGNGTAYAQNNNIIAASLWNVQELRNLQKTTEKEIETQKETKQSLDNLKSTIEKLDEKNGKLQGKILWLTGATVLLAVVQVVIVMLSLRQPDSTNLHSPSYMLTPTPKIILPKRK